MVQARTGREAVTRHWDLFCNVVDNFGDAGVCWRLARQLVAEHGLAVRLWIDDLAVLQPLVPELGPDLARQMLEGVEIRLWPHAWSDPALGAVVIEAFGCALPEGLVEAMARRSPAPVWINLEYLSAEDWVEGSHGLPSRHPRLPLTKHFYFPGFTAATGGLLRERGLLERRAHFQADPVAQREFWRSLGLPARPDGLCVSIFAYAEAPLEALLRVMGRTEQPIYCLIPRLAMASVSESLGTNAAARRLGSLTLCPFSFLPQDRYDQLLWACDLNFVRGEDSFVRAQWAGRPMVWQPYRQSEDAHLRKLEAFLARLAAVSAGPSALAQAALARAWSGAGDLASAWPALWSSQNELGVAAQAWAECLASQPDLASRLLEFVQKRL